MMKQDIAVLLLNPFTHDARVDKEASSLAQAGNRVTVYALWQDGLDIEETRHGYKIIRLKLKSPAARENIITPVLKYIEFTIRLLRLTRLVRHTVFHSNDALTLPAGWLASRMSRAKLVYDAHELETGRNFGNSRLSGIYRLLWAWPEKAFIRSADAVITVSQSIAEEIAQLYKIKLPTVVLNCPSSLPYQRSNRLREELNIPVHQKILLYQGVIGSGRGIEQLFYAVQDLEDVAAVALGDGPLLADLRARIQKGDWRRVYLPGRVPLQYLPNYTASADLGVLLSQPTCRSYLLSLPNKLFEYLHAGLPVLGSDLPEFRRVILEYRVGEVISPSAGHEEIAAAIRKILSDPAQYSAYAQNARNAAAIFRWENEAAKLVQCYQGLETSR